MTKRKHRGVAPVGSRWRAMVQVDGKPVHVGYYDTEEEAVRARANFMTKLGRVNTIVNLEGEEWRVSPTLGLPTWVSNKGRIKTTDFDRMGFEKLYKFQKGWRKRYYSVVIGQKRYMVHRLVAEAFLGIQKSLEVNHIDNDSFNNCIENLEYVTHRENISHGFGGASGTTFTRGMWMSVIKFNGKAKTLGYFKTKEEAHERYLQALRDIGEVNKYAKF